MAPSQGLTLISKYVVWGQNSIVHQLSISEIIYYMIRYKHNIIIFNVHIRKTTTCIRQGSS